MSRANDSTDFTLPLLSTEVLFSLQYVMLWLDWNLVDYALNFVYWWERERGGGESISNFMFNEYGSSKELLINVSKQVLSCITQFITKVTSFSPFFGPSSDLHTRTHESDCKNCLLTLDKEISSFTLTCKTSRKCIWLVETM